LFCTSAGTIQRVSHGSSGFPRLTVRAMKAASSPCALYQSPLSKIRIVSSSLAGRPRKNLIKPTSSSTCTTISNWTPSQRLPSHLHLWTRGHCQRYEPALEDTARRCIQRRRAVNYVILARRGMHLADQISIAEFSWIVRSMH